MVVWLSLGTWYQEDDHVMKEWVTGGGGGSKLLRKGRGCLRCIIWATPVGNCELGVVVGRTKLPRLSGMPLKGILVLSFVEPARMSHLFLVWVVLTWNVGQ